jgi:hypothetical protein
MRARKVLVGHTLLSFDHLLDMLLEYHCANMHSFSVFWSQLTGLTHFSSLIKYVHFHCMFK